MNIDLHEVEIIFNQIMLILCSCIVIVAATAHGLTNAEIRLLLDAEMVSYSGEYSPRVNAQHI